MRQVALLVLAVALIAIPSVSNAIPGDGSRIRNGADECSNSATASVPCLRVDVTDQNNVVLTRFYFYAAAATCTPQANPFTPFENACSGQPGQNGGVFGMPPPLGILGLVYQESNHLDGLQRNQIPGVVQTGDLMLLL